MLPTLWHTGRTKHCERKITRFIWPWCNSEMLQVPEPASLQGDEGQQHSKAPASCEKGDCDLDLELEKS